MIDLHSHILPGIDDGARTISDSLRIARQSVEQGVTHMLCTPHIHQGIFDNDLNSIQLSFDSLIQELDNQQIPLKLGVGSEVRITPEIIAWVSSSAIPFIGQWQGKHALLLELPHSHVPPGIENLIKWCFKHNIQPVIPHPERNRDIMADYKKLLMLDRLGCIFQVTAGVFASRFSERSLEVAQRMLKEGLITYVASDVHNIDRRPNDMKIAKEAIASLANENVAEQLTLSTPLEITKEIKWK